jgi:two-component system chemotaxis sensor kinase CheA
VNELDLRQELLAAFESEYREHLKAMRAVLDAGNVSGSALRDVFRRAHSLKGAARAVELPDVEAVAHELETLLYHSVEQGEALPAAAVATVRRGLDSIDAGMRGPEVAQQNTVLAAPLAADQTLRVPAAEIDRLGEMVHGLSDAIQEGEQAHGDLAWAEAELRELVRLLEPRSVPGTAPGAGRSENEFERRLRALSRRMSTARRAGGARHWQIDQAAQSLRAQLERVTLVTAESVFGPLEAMARDLARELGGEAEVQLSGMTVLAERRVLQALRDPAIQMLRNAVGHGMRHGPVGRLPAIELRVRLRAGRLELRVSDDGPGPDLAAIERTARRHGLLAADAPTPDEARLLALVFEPGFSTASTVDRLSGRGMGLSIVAEAAARLRGTARMIRRGAAAGRPGGTVLLVSVPLAARRQTLLLVEAGGHLFGLPGPAIARLLRVSGETLAWLEDGPVARLPDTLLSLGALASLVGGNDPLRSAGPGMVLPVAVVAGTGGPFGVAVEHLREVRTLVVRAPEVVGLDRRLVAGIALVEQDRPVLVLEPDALVAALRTRTTVREPAPAAPAAAPERAASPARARAQATILVVDDSITTRTLEKTILQAQGYRVLIAVDGVEALSVLRTAQWEVDVVVADVEMPRLDGFGLLAAMRADPRLKAIPAVLMTSRNQEADVKRGLELGARAYIAKQDFDQGALLATIGQLLP